MKPEQMAALRALLATFLDAVKAGGSLGAPAGPLYAAVMHKLSLSQFESVMGALVSTGKIRKSGNLYHFVADL